jgi:hypothetical protein
MRKVFIAVVLVSATLTACSQYFTDYPTRSGVPDAATGDAHHGPADAAIVDAGHGGHRPDAGTGGGFPDAGTGGGFPDAGTAGGSRR